MKLIKNYGLRFITVLTIAMDISFKPRLGPILTINVIINVMELMSAVLAFL